MHSVSLPDFVGRFPTPCAGDSLVRNKMRPSRAATNRKTGYLSEMIGNWPTPTSTERSGTNPNTGKGEDLSKTAKMWPTPRGEGTRVIENPEAARARMDQLKAEGRQTGGIRNLAAEARMFPTPRAGKTTDEDEESWLARHAAGKVATPPLALAARMLPTPSSGGESGGDDLVTAVDGSLSPDWVSWLMGLPVGWTSLEPLSREEYLDWLHAQQDGTWWEIERGLPRVATGIPNRVNRLKCLGNGIVPASLALFLRGTR